MLSSSRRILVHKKGIIKLIASSTAALLIRHSWVQGTGFLTSARLYNLWLHQSLYSSKMSEEENFLMPPMSILYCHNFIVQQAIYLSNISNQMHALRKC